MVSTARRGRPAHFFRKKFSPKGAWIFIFVGLARAGDRGSIPVIPRDYAGFLLFLQGLVGLTLVFDRLLGAADV